MVETVDQLKEVQRLANDLPGSIIKAAILKTDLAEENEDDPDSLYNFLNDPNLIGLRKILSNVLINREHKPEAELKAAARAKKKSIICLVDNTVYTPQGLMYEPSYFRMDVEVFRELWHIQNPMVEAYHRARDGRRIALHKMIDCNYKLEAVLTDYVMNSR